MPSRTIIPLKWAECSRKGDKVDQFEEKPGVNLMDTSIKSPAKIITLASGKEGVGKTNISVNLALSLSDGGRPICLLDGDPGLANVDVLLGLSPEFSLMDFLEDRCSLSEVLVAGPGSLKVISGGSALDRLPTLKTNERRRLAKIVRHLYGYDAVVIDASAGISDQVLNFLKLANIPVLVIIPDPTSLTDAYALLKAYHQKGNIGPVFILVNQVKSARHAELVFSKFQDVVNKFLDIRILLFGHVKSDPKVMEAVSRRTPFVTLFPDTPASLSVRDLADALLSNHDDLKGSGNFEHLLHTPDPEEVVEKATAESTEGRKSPSKFHRQSDITTLLLAEGHVTPVQVDYAKKVQSKLDTSKKILEILKDLGHVNDDQIKSTLYKHRTGIRLGTLLVELGYISEKDLSGALNQQKRKKGQKRLGEILVENDMITESELIQVFSIYLGFPYVEPTLETVDQSLLKKAPKKFLLGHKFLPLEKEEHGPVKIAMADPLDRAALDAAKQLFGPNVEIAITMEKLIKEVLEVYEISTSKPTFETHKSQATELVEILFENALRKKASDIHIEPLKNRIRIRFRKDGALIHHLDVSKDLGPSLVNRIKVLASVNIAERRRHQEGRILMDEFKGIEGVDIRVSFYVTLFGEKVVMRILNKKAELFNISDLGMGSKMLDRFTEDALEIPHGVVIITGPTGAGKTTSLYAAINYCNKMDTSIITAEEPIEYVVEGISQCSIDPKIGLTFEETLRHMLRQDPDIIILGEIRDKFSAESAIQAALTGHKVLTTFHTEDSIGGLLRLMNMGIEPFMISSTVVSVVAQRLLKKVCSYCQTDYTPTATDLRRLKYQANDLSGYQFKAGKGCARCDFTGYSDRTGVFELLVLNESVKEAILERKTSYEIRRMSIETSGLVTLLEDGLAKAAKGIISISEVIGHLPVLEPPRPLEQIYRLLGTV